MLQDKIQKAMKFAAEHHADQKVPGTNANYMLHISNVLMEVLIAYQHGSDFDLELAAQMAVLHDVVEDTPVTSEEIRKEFGNRVAEGVLALSKNNSLSTKEEKIEDSLDRINQLYREAGIVKLADRITNLQKPPAFWNNDKRTYYLKEAELIAASLAGKHHYLEERIKTKIEEYRNYLVG